MRNKAKGRGLWILALTVLVLSWVFVVPVQLGGSTVYSATVGTSMVPMFHKGDLAVLRQSPSYKVGDVVLYESPVLHRPVLHRIIVIQNGHYFFKGDNNDFVDPGYATRNELLAKLWFGIPHAGRVLSWFGVPSHASVLAGLVVAFLFIGGGARTTSRRRRKRRSERAPGSSPPVRIRASRRFLHRPRKSAENIFAGIASVIALAALVAGFGAPLSKPVPVTGYHQTGAFSYTAKVLRPNNTYPTGVARTGQPLFLKAFDKVEIGFAYRFSSSLAHDVHGTVSLKALIQSDSSWHSLYTLEKKTAFSGDTVSVGGTFSLEQMNVLLDQISTESGAVGADYTIDLQPIVHVTGIVAGKRISATFSPVLPFTADQTVLKLNVAQPATIPGATFTAPSPEDAIAAAVHPSVPGTIPGVGPNFLLLLRYHVAVSAMRGIGLGLLGLAALAFASKFFKRRREVWSRETRIAFRYGCIVVDVVSFAGGAAQASTAVPDFESLAKLAQYCERPILRETRGQSPAYAVEDDGRLYTYRPAGEPSVSRLAAAEAS